jgi:hypothetical protein
MSKLPKFSSNKKYWMHLNRLVFGESCQCPSCSRVLQERYVGKYLWCPVCRKKYRATAWRGSCGLRVTDSRSQEALEQFVQDYVRQGSLVVSDKWWAYEELPLLGYVHESHNQ